MNPIIGLLIVVFFWVFLSTIINRILNILIDEDEYDEDYIMMGSVFSPITAIVLLAIYTIKLFIKISNWIVDASIKKFKEIKKFILKSIEGGFQK